MEKRIAEGSWTLPDLAIIALSGKDAVSFLHGQLSNAVAQLDEHQALPAAYCNAQGRILANGPLWLAPDHSVHWAVASDLTQQLAQRLRLYALRQDVTVLGPTSTVMVGHRGKAHVPASLHQKSPWSCSTIGGENWIVTPVSTPEIPSAWQITCAPGPTATDASAWNAARLAAGWPNIRAVSSGQFLPAALDMDLNGTIDFHKGCYPGQEVIARMHYRGTAKRRLAYGLCLDPGSSISADEPLTDLLYRWQEDDGQPVGRIVEAVQCQGQLHIAIEIQLQGASGGRYALRSPTGPEVSLQLIHPPAA